MPASVPFRLNLGKLETASLDEMIALGVQGQGFDVGFMMTGFIRKDQVPNLSPRPGHPIVGVGSTGLHSNGYTGGRHAVLRWNPSLEYRGEWSDQYRGRWKLDDKPEALEGRTVMEEMMVPTASYLPEAVSIGERFVSLDIYGVNITGNGLHNFNRAGKDVSFEITDPLDLLPVHRFLIQESGWDPQTSYKKQNNGMGFAYIVPTLDVAERIVRLINDRGRNSAKIVGEVRAARKSETDLRTTLHKPYKGPALDFVGYSA
jgi:phosphoribosylaminoimidazole (AIR) synthetase